METFLLVIHVLVSLFLIFIVLVQGGKGAQMGAAFGGGSSQTLFGGRGAATFLSKLTTIMAVVFMLTSLVLAVVAGRGDDTSGIDLDTPPEQGSPISTDLPTGTMIDPAAPDAPAQPAAPVAPTAPAAPTQPGQDTQ